MVIQILMTKKKLLQKIGTTESLIYKKRAYILSVPQNRLKWIPFDHGNILYPTDVHIYLNQCRRWRRRWVEEMGATCV